MSRLQTGLHAVRSTLPMLLVLALVLGALLPAAVLAAQDDKPGKATFEQMGNRGGRNYYGYPRYNARSAYRYNQRQYPSGSPYNNSYQQPTYSQPMYDGYKCGCQAHRYYRVQYGDTLSGIARQYGVSVQTLARANGLRNPHRIYAGQVLHIPAYGYCR